MLMCPRARRLILGLFLEPPDWTWPSGRPGGGLAPGRIKIRFRAAQTPLNA